MKPKRISIIGPGDIDFHFKQLLGLNDNKLNSEIEEIAKTLADSGVEIELLPDRGISIEIAKLYKKFHGKRVVGSVPKSDSTFGIKHLEPYIQEEFDEKPLFDEIINSGDWFKHDLIKGLLGDAILYLGSSPGTDGELNYAIYLYKLMKKFKDGVEVSGKRIHPDIRAGENFSVIVYSPFLLNKKLSDESEAYMKKFGVKLHYVNSSDDLKTIISK